MKYILCYLLALFYGTAASAMELKATVNAMDGTAYTGTNGVVVNGHDVELDVAAEQGAMYVYTSEGWAPLPVQDTWTAAAH